MQSTSTILLDNAVHEFAKLPGIGQKTALRLALHMLRQKSEDVVTFAHAMTDLKEGIRYCRLCHNISDTDICPICSDPLRDTHTICVVESIKDVLAIENTQQYRGLYHVLGGVISPMNGIGPSDLQTESLIKRVHDGEISELIFALSPTMEGDTTCFYLYRRIADTDIKMTVLARGVAVGDELEYADEATLGRSIINRTILEYTKK